ncbi:hypothetical protein [Salmonella enterica]|uniref:Uncharacterized protein n=1 Tax=Salmonella enterica subsp. enterica serovar Dessau TaxID=2564349 RepID=A0A8E5IMK8_SALET|nr:hypothetical protein [Salmonella enterica]QUS47074.1 hypothetical protein F1331_25760 [Salmonella enterica subsp. enterica serovar Dessau]
MAQTLVQLLLLFLLRVVLLAVNPVTGERKPCLDDKACNPPGVDGPGLPGICDKTAFIKGHPPPEGLCLSLISPTNLYELATSNYLAGGGSGFRVLQRNTTQVDTKVQQLVSRASDSRTRPDVETARASRHVDDAGRGAAVTSAAVARAVGARGRHRTGRASVACACVGREGERRGVRGSHEEVSVRVGVRADRDACGTPKTHLDLRRRRRPGRARVHHPVTMRQRLTAAKDNESN